MNQHDTIWGVLFTVMQEIVWSKILASVNIRLILGPHYWPATSKFKLDSL